jgi:predicted RNase H-like HicB family nuclease
MTARLEVKLYRDERGTWIAECPSLPGCVSEGTTRDEALASLRGLMPACMEVRRGCGLTDIVETAAPAGGPAAEEAGGPPQRHAPTFGPEAPVEAGVETCVVDVCSDGETQ